MARHLSQGAPSEGQAALSVDLSRRYDGPTSSGYRELAQVNQCHRFLCRSPLELFNTYTGNDMNFNPPVAPPATKKRVRIFGASQVDTMSTCRLPIKFLFQDRFVIGAALFDEQLQRRAESVLATAEEAELDFNRTKCTLNHT